MPYQKFYYFYILVQDSGAGEKDPHFYSIFTAQFHYTHTDTQSKLFT